jgi:hypothetical protein
LNVGSFLSILSYFNFNIAKILKSFYRAKNLTIFKTMVTLEENFLWLSFSFFFQILVHTLRSGNCQAFFNKTTVIYMN